MIRSSENGLLRMTSVSSSRRTRGNSRGEGPTRRKSLTVHCAAGSRDDFPPRDRAVDHLHLAVVGFHVRAHIRSQGALPSIPKTNRNTRFRWKKAIYRERNHVERFFDKLKQFRRIANRYDKLGTTFFAFIQAVAVRMALRSIEPTP